MIPLARALWQRLLFEPVFFLTAAAVVASQVDPPVPAWVKALAIAVYGLAVRAKVKPTRK